MFFLSKLLILLIICYCFNCVQAQLLMHRRFRRLPQTALKIRQRLQEKINYLRLKNTETICYDIVGCFELPHKRSPLQKIPEDPSFLNTKFYLFRRDINFSNPQIIRYDDYGVSLSKSKFNYSQPLKMFIHGYMGKWNDYGNLVAADAFLKIYDCNVVLMDWSIGARGPHYATAAANTELVGRQLGMLILKIVEKGLNPDDIHLLGFSLGAHVSGCASEVLKKKGHLIGRITGLDAASPLFRTNHLREKHKKLDKEDAKFVDIIHTDASPVATDGFGLWAPIGHVDFFPNGGQEQPGCTDTKQSIVVSHFDRTLTREIACSHIRAWHLYQETLLSKIKNESNACQFIAFSCPSGLVSFERGRCFPQIGRKNGPLALDPAYRTEIGQFGENVMGEGVMYFLTKGSSPFCGTQLQASIQISQKTGQIQGLIYLKLKNNNVETTFKIICQIVDYVMTGAVMSGLAVIDYNSLENTEKIDVYLKFTDINNEDIVVNDTQTPNLYVDKISVRDMYGNTWNFCQRDTLVDYDNPLFVLKKNSCLL